MLAALRAAAAAGGVEFVAFDGGAAPLETARALFARAAAVVGLHGGQAWPSTPLSSLPHSAPGTSIRTRAPLKTDHAACHAARTHRATHRATVPPTQLANALFMREGSMLLELGFASPLAAHYAHAAAALGLRYEACTRSDSPCTPSAHPVAFSIDRSIHPGAARGARRARCRRTQPHPPAWQRPNRSSERRAAPRRARDGRAICTRRALKMANAQLSILAN